MNVHPFAGARLRRLRVPELYGTLGYDPNDPAVREAIRLGLPPIRGGAVGSGPAATFVNGLAGFMANQALFNDRTTLNAFAQPSQSAGAFFGTTPIQFSMPHRGIIAGVEVVTNGVVTTTHGTGTTALTDYANGRSIYSAVNLSVDGTPLELAHGIAYNARLQASARSQAADPQTVMPLVAAGANAWEVHTYLPVAYDNDTLHGALFAQSDSIYATLSLTPEVLANVIAVTGNDTAVGSAFSVQVFVYAWDIPYVDVNGGRVGVIPESLPTIHRMLEYSQPVVANGDTTLYLPEVPGQIQRLFCWIDNTNGALIDPASWSGVRFTYAETETPLNYQPMSVLLGRNARQYNGKVGPKVAVLDFADSNARNALYPANVTRPNVVATLPSTITPNAGARFYVAAEWLEGVV